MAASASTSISLSARIPDASQFTGLLGDFKTKASGVTTPELPLARVQELAGKFNITIPDISSWSSAIPGDVTQLVKAFPDATALAKPLAEPLQRVRTLLSFPLKEELKRIEDAITALTPASLESPETLLNGLIKPLSDVASFFQNSETLKLSGTIAGFLGAKDVEKFPAKASSAVLDLQTLLHDRLASLLLAITGLATVSTTVGRTERLTDAIHSAFSWEATDARYQAVLRSYADGPSSLASAVAGVNFEDAGQVAAVRTQLQNVNDAFVDFQVSLSRDLAFSEALIAVLNTGALQDTLTQAADALGKLDTAQLKALAASVQKTVESLKNSFKIDPNLSLDQFKKLLGDGLEQTRSVIEKFDLSKVRDVLQSALKLVEAPFKVLQDLKQTIEETVRGAMAGLKEALSRIDLSVIHRSADQFLDQLGGNIADLDKLFTEVRSSIEDVLKEAAATLDGLKRFVLDPQNGLKKKIEDVLQTVFSLLDSLNLKAAIDEVAGILNPINVELGKIEFAPVFDASTDAIGTVNDVLKTVAPLLVTDDLKKKLGEATAFLRKIDFDEIADALNSAFDEILSSVNEDALGTIKNEYAKVVDAIDKFDPSAALEALQKEVFDPVIVELEKVKPAEILQPLQTGFDATMNALRKFDPAQSLAFAISFFDDLMARFHELSPEKLLQPVEEVLGDVKTQIEKLLMVDKVLDVMNQVTQFFQPIIDGIEVPKLLDALENGFQAFKAELALFDPATVFSPFAGVLEAALSRAGAAVEATGIVDAITSIAAKGASAEERLLALPSKLSEAASEMNKLDLDTAISTLRSRHAAVQSAFTARGGSSTVQIELLGRITTLDPLPLLTPIAVKSGRVRAALASKATDFDQKVTALKPKLQPFTDIRDALASFLDTFGVIREAIAHPFQQLTGSQAGSPRELIMRFVDELDPAKWRGKLEPVLNALHDKVKGLLSDVVLNPIAEVLSSLKSITGLLDISTLIQPVTEVFEDVEQTINQINPAPIIKALDDKYKQFLAVLEKLNPASFISEIQKLYVDDVIGVLKAVSPRDLLLPPLRELFDKIKSLLVSVDVEVLFKPILDRLKALKGQLADGLKNTGGAYKQMLATLDSAGGAQVSVSVSVT